MAKLYDLRVWRDRIQPAQLIKEPLCRYCIARGLVVQAIIADHVVPHRGDMKLFLRGELQSLCGTCHSAAKQAEERGSGLRGCGIDGLPLDAKHHWNA